MSDTRGRVALVTGAARGIGAATVRRLHGDGYHVIALDACLGDGGPQPEGVRYGLATRADLKSVGALDPQRIVTTVCDVRDADALSAVVDETVGRHGRLDAAVAAAAVITGGAPQWETPAGELRTLFDIDVVGVWNTAAAVIPAMLSGPNPHNSRFVAIASAAGERGLHGLSAYCAAKHAVIGLVRGIAADLVGTGVTAVAVSPGSTSTDMLDATAAIYGIESPEALAAHQLIRRTLSPDEVAATIVFCCSPEAASLHGSVVSATGGFVG